MKVRAGRRTLICFASWIPPERASRDLLLAHVVPDAGVAVELVDPEEVILSVTYCFEEVSTRKSLSFIAGLTINVSPAMVGTILADTELDLTHPLKAGGLIQPASRSAILFQAHIISPAIATFTAVSTAIDCKRVMIGTYSISGNLMPRSKGPTPQP